MDQSLWSYFKFDIRILRPYKVQLINILFLPHDVTVLLQAGGNGGACF